MALADTSKAIGKITKLLSEQLNAKTGLTITVGRPEPLSGGETVSRLNLFLYEALFDPNLKNVSIDEGRPCPLWLVLKYLMTAFDEDGNTDTIRAHEYLGEGIRALQELSFLQLTSSLPADILGALQDNPETLKISFDETPADLLSRLIQGTDEKYRFSVGFQIRPVMITTGEPTSYSLLVGIDYTKSPVEIIGEEGVQTLVIPSIGPEITQMYPSKVEANETLSILGSNLGYAGLSVRLGQVELPIMAQSPDKLECLVDGSISGGSVVSAGSQPLSVFQILPNGRHRTSNLVVMNLLPTLGNGAPAPGSLTRVNPADLASNVFGVIDMTGVLLGTERDDIFVALFKGEKVVKVFDEFMPVPSPPAPSPSVPQTQMRLQMKQEDAVPPGEYRIILRVNGQQAKNSPIVRLIIP